MRKFFPQNLRNYAFLRKLQSLYRTTKVVYTRSQLHMFNSESGGGGNLSTSLSESLKRIRLGMKKRRMRGKRGGKKIREAIEARKMKKLQMAELQETRDASQANLSSS